MSLKHDGRKNNKLTKENFLHENLKTNYSANKKQIGNQFNLGVRCDGSNNLDPVEMDPKMWIQESGSGSNNVGPVRSRYAIMLYWLVIDRFVRYQYRL